jgi:hypothetical protein
MLPLTALVVMNAAALAQSPMEVAKNIYDAQQRGDWARVVSFLHPMVLEDFKQHILEFAKLEAELSPPQHRTSLSSLNIDSIDQLAVLSPSLAMERFLRAKHRRPDDSDSPHAVRRRNLIGEIRESDSVSHVLTRVVLGPPYPALPFALKDWVEVLTLKQSHAGWRAMLNGGLVYGEGGEFSVGFEQ